MPRKGEKPAHKSKKSTIDEFKNTWMSPLALALIIKIITMHWNHYIQSSKKAYQVVLEHRPTITLRNKLNYITKRLAALNTLKEPPTVVPDKLDNTFDRLTSLNQHRYKSNLTKEQVFAIKTLKKNNQIVIKQADKGSGITIIDRQQSYQHLQVENIYERINQEYTIRSTAKINLHLKEMVKTKKLTKEL